VSPHSAARCALFNEARSAIPASPAKSEQKSSSFSRFCVSRDARPAHARRNTSIAVGNGLAFGFASGICGGRARGGDFTGGGDRITVPGMKSYEVIRQAVEEPGVKAVAAALRVSAGLVYKWCEPAPNKDDPDQSGARNPLDRVRELYMITRDIRLIRWLCNQAGGFFVSNPQRLENPDRDVQMFRSTRAMVRDFSELLSRITEAHDDDGKIDADEASQIRQHWEELKANVEQFVQCCEEGHYTT
jgi:hypothetical protein